MYIFINHYSLINVSIDKLISPHFVYIENPLGFKVDMYNIRN